MLIGRRHLKQYAESHCNVHTLKKKITMKMNHILYLISLTGVLFIISTTIDESIFGTQNNQLLSLKFQCRPTWKGR